LPKISKIGQCVPELIKQEKPR